MAADLLARGLAAAIRDGARPVLARFSDLSGTVIPAAIDTIEAGAAGTWGRYAADARATAALAAAHPTFCRADASGRHFRFVAGEIDIAAAGATGVGDDRPAIQAAIRYAAAVGITRVVNRSLADIELWEPAVAPGSAIAGGSAAYFAARTLLVPACDALELDFGGARIRLKGPTGGNRFPGQDIADMGAGAKWLGGFITLGGPVRRLRIANVDVDGGFAGDTVGQSNANLYDKGFMAQDFAGCETLVQENVALHGFAGEIMYDNSFALHLNRDCHYYNAGHSCWNPGGSGRVVAHNLQAGIARQPAEVLGGVGHEYFGGRFYAGGTGCSFIGTGPAFLAGRPYTWSERAATGAPPFVTFHGTRFETCNTLLIGSYTRGSIVTVDTATYATLSTPAVQDIDIDIEAWADRATNFLGFGIGGPPDLTSQIAGCPAGTYYEKTRNVTVRLDCRRTALAAASDWKVSPGVAVLAGLLDRDSCRFSVRGAAGVAWEVIGTPPANFAIPLTVTEPSFLQLAYGTGGIDFNSSDKVYKVAWSAMSLNPVADGTFNVTLDTTYGYTNGQRVRFFVDAVAGAQTGNRIIRFAKNGAGLRLNADRTLRRFGEYLDLEWNGAAAKWCEVACLDQGP